VWARTGSGKSAACQSPGAEFLLQLPNDISDEIVKSPADALGHLLHSCQPVPELWIHSLRLATQQGGQFVQRRLHAAVEPLVNVPVECTLGGVI